MLASETAPVLRPTRLDRDGMARPRMGAERSRDNAGPKSSPGLYGAGTAVLNERLPTDLAELRRDWRSSSSPSMR